MQHPASALVAWLAATLALQFLGWHGLVVVALALGAAGNAVFRRWWRLLRRARWLLASLWLILAYGTPGEAAFDLTWAPTEAGLTEAGLHVLRLVLLLGLLAWLFERLDRKGLMAGLWVVARPLARLGLAVDRAVVRLALVFDYLDHAPPRGSWRHLLQDDGAAVGGPHAIHLEIRPWARADTLLLGGVAALLTLAAWVS